MAKNAGKSLAAIQKLLAERVQIEQWLARLGLAGDSTPEAVRERVKADYQAKLKDVLAELAEYGDELREALRRQQQTRDGLARQEKEAAEHLAEAEVRHAVGEYDEGKWRDIHADHMGRVVKIREELKNTEEEIKRLDDAVQGLSAPATPPAAPAAPAAPVSTSSSFGGQKGKQMDALDELAFLKSVTDDEKGRPNAARASGQQKAPEHIKPPAAAAPPPPPPPPPPAPPRVEEAKAPALPAVDVGAGGVSAIDNSGPGKRMTAALDKSLKCKECGTMNLPTEWYCEKCGAELSESL